MIVTGTSPLGQTKQAKESNRETREREREKCTTEVFGLFLFVELFYF